MLRTAITLIALLIAGAATAQDVGTAAAVNQSARGTPPGGAVRTIALGDNVVHNERVVTDAGGLVQILFVDGTTLMMGPNSELVIDSFFYDPNANSAQVAVTMTKGVLRFIGGLTSKSPDGATIGTPVGTIGIRGGIVDVDLETSDGTPQHIDMLFGTEVTLEQGLALIGRLYQGGYSLVMGAGGNITVQKTPPEWSSQIQQALAGRPGTSGGSSNPPNDEDVAESGVPDANSDTALGDFDEPPLTEEEIEQLLAAVATYDELREFIADETGDDGETDHPGGVEPPPNEPPAGSTVLLGASAGIVHLINYDASGNQINERFGTAKTTGTTLTDGSLTTVAFDNADNAIYGYFDVVTDAMCINCRARIRIEDGGDAIGVVTDPTGHYQAFGSGSVTEHQVYDGIVPANLATHQCACAFLDWGYWTATGTAAAPDGQSVYGEIDGTWVGGDLATVEELADLAADPYDASAEYWGHVIGTAQTSTSDPYLAAGGLYIYWDFASRTGSITIENFDDPLDIGAGIGLTGNLAADGDQFFAGAISDGESISGMARGGFVNGPYDYAQGAAGDFAISGPGYQAAGIFAGEQNYH